MTPKCIPTLGVALMWGLRMFNTLVGKENKHQIFPWESQNVQSNGAQEELQVS
jgi:hypothetical protein